MSKKIIITGGATRMGAAIARKLSGPNKEILIHYNKSKLKAEKLKKELSSKGTKVYLIKGDLSKETDIKKIIKFAKSKLKYFDCLVNNASLFENDELEITLNPKIRQYDVKNKLYPKGRSTMGMPVTKVTKKRDKKWKHGK